MVRLIFILLLPVDQALQHAEHLLVRVSVPAGQVVLELPATHYSLAQER